MIIYKWEPETQILVQKVLAYAKTHPSTPNQYFSKIKISDIKKREGTKDQIQASAIGGVNEEEWLNASFIKRLHLEGSNRFFSVASYNCTFKNGSREKATPSPIIGYFYLKFTETGIKMIPFKLKNEPNKLVYMLE